MVFVNCICHRGFDLRIKREEITVAKGCFSQRSWFVWLKSCHVLTSECVCMNTFTRGESDVRVSRKKLERLEDYKYCKLHVGSLSLSLSMEVQITSHLIRYQNKWMVIFFSPKSNSTGVCSGDRPRKKALESGVWTPAWGSPRDGEARAPGLWGIASP